MALTLVLAVSWGVVEAGGRGAIRESIADVSPAEAAVVLGTSRLTRGGALNPYFSNRIAAAAALYAAGKVRYVIVSGNRSGGYDEPEDMREALVLAGVPADAIYRDGAGFRTVDSVLRARDVFGQTRVVVVSQRSHLARALFLARSAGLDDEGFVAPDPKRLNVFVTVREIGARVRALFDAAFRRPEASLAKTVSLGVDPPT